jgi:hypothetical protein
MLRLRTPFTFITINMEKNLSEPHVVSDVKRHLEEVRQDYIKLADDETDQLIANISNGVAIELTNVITGLSQFQTDGDGWVKVEDGEVPKGKWQVYLEREYIESNIQVAVCHDEFTTIAGHFAWDMPTITHYRPLPSKPKD